MKFFVTYGFGSDQRNNYSVVEAEDYAAARLDIHAICGGAWANVYTEEGFKGQAEQYCLTEIPLQAQTRKKTGP